MSMDAGPVADVSDQDAGELAQARLLAERLSEAQAQLALERELRLTLEGQLVAQAADLRSATAALADLTSRFDNMVTERTREIAAAREAAEAENAAKTQFLAAMSHEIRTPLNGILGMASALADTLLDSQQELILKVLRESGRLLHNIVDDVLDLRKIEEGKLELDSQPTDLRRLLDQTCAPFAPRITAKGLEFCRDDQGELGEGALWARIDPTRFQQVLWNLLSNATKFTEAGGISLISRITSGQGDSLLLTVQVQDSGVGMTADQRGRLFQPYVQADPSIYRSHGGTGLGLTIARLICERMGGTLTCESAPQLGSTFTASFMVERCPAQRKEAQKVDISILSRRNWRVLIAEDNRTNRMVLRHMFKGLGLETIWVEHGRAAVEAYEAGHIDLILMDVNMPVEDGLSATRRIRAHEERRGKEPVPIIAVSANAMLHQVAQYLQCGVNDHVPKPVRKSHLLQVMSRALEARDALDNRGGSRHK